MIRVYLSLTSKQDHVGLVQPSNLVNMCRVTMSSSEESTDLRYLLVFQVVYGHLGLPAFYTFAHKLSFNPFCVVTYEPRQNKAHTIEHKPSLTLTPQLVILFMFTSFFYCLMQSC